MVQILRSIDVSGILVYTIHMWVTSAKSYDADSPLLPQQLDLSCISDR